MIDWERVEELRTEVGPDDFDEVVQLFLEEVEETVARLSDDQPPDQLAADLHLLRGSVSSLGFSELSRKCMQAERSIAESHTVSEDLAAVLAAYAASRTEFVSKLPGNI